MGDAHLRTPSSCLLRSPYELTNYNAAELNPRETSQGIFLNYVSQKSGYTILRISTKRPVVYHSKVSSQVITGESKYQNYPENTFSERRNGRNMLIQTVKNTSITNCNCEYLLMRTKNRYHSHQIFHSFGESRRNTTHPQLTCWYLYSCTNRCTYHLCQGIWKGS